MLTEAMPDPGGKRSPWLRHRATSLHVDGHRFTRLRQRGEVRPVPGAVSRAGRAAVVRDQHGTTAAPGVPGPCEVADALWPGPGHEGVDQGGRSVVLADLARNDR